MQSINRDIASIWDMTQAIQRLQMFTNSLTFDEYIDDIRMKSGYCNNCDRPIPYNRLI